MADATQWGQPINLQQFLAIASEAKRDLKLKPAEWFRILGTNLDSGGDVQQLLDTSGNVTEANSSAINSGIATDYSSIQAIAPPVFKTGTTSNQTTLAYTKRKIIDCVLTATAGGEITSTAIVAAAAGYQTCVCITGLWSDQTDASISMAIDTTSGVDVGPTAWAWATTANAVTDYSPGVMYLGSADNEALNASCAAGQAQSSCVA